MDARREAVALRRALARQGDPARAANEKAYLKSDLEFLGVSVPAVRRAAKAWLRAHPDVDHAGLAALAQALHATPEFELRLLAGVLCEARSAVLGTPDLAWMEEVLRGCRTWALVDQWAPRVIGPILGRDRPARRRILRRWAKDPDFWLRRSALLALLGDLRRDPDADWRLWRSLAVPLLPEREFFVRKAIGWCLRERAKLRPDQVRAFLDTHRGGMAGLAVREAEKGLRAYASDGPQRSRRSRKTS